MRSFVLGLVIAALNACTLQVVTAFTTSGVSSLRLACRGSLAHRSSCKVQMLSSEGVIGRRSLLSEAALVAGVAGLPLPASAKAGAKSAGAWAKHEGEFTEEELDGFTETKSGLLYKDIEVGTGVIPQTGQKIKAHYSGYLLESGKKFDSSYDRGKPLPFAVGTGQVIKGWDEALLSMKVGSKRMLVIPAKLAYGKKAVGNGLIPANSDLVFYVELVTIST